MYLGPPRPHLRKFLKLSNIKFVPRGALNWTKKAMAKKMEGAKARGSMAVAMKILCVQFAHHANAHTCFFFSFFCSAFISIVLALAVYRLRSVP